MTRTIDEMVAVMIAARDGKKIQFLAIRDSEGHPITTEWRDWGPNPYCWDWIRFDYRVKPEPRRIYVHEYKQGIATDFFPTKELAESAGQKYVDYVRTVTFVEELQ